RARRRRLRDEPGPRRDRLDRAPRPPGQSPGRAADRRGDDRFGRAPGIEARRHSGRFVQGDRDQAGLALVALRKGRAPRLVLLREAEEQRVQRLALLLAERREELVLDLLRERA